jgi:hypothetical protein
MRPIRHSRQLGRDSDVPSEQLMADLTLDRHILQEIVRKGCGASRALHPAGLSPDDVNAKRIYRLDGLEITGAPVALPV